MSKLCNTCGGSKPLSAYYRDKGKPDGYRTQCKDCDKIASELLYQKKMKDPEWREKERVRATDKYYRLGYKSTYRQRPEKEKAGNAIQYFEKVKGFELHHWSYNEEHHRDVFKLKRHDHNEVHRFLEYCTETFYYKTLDGVLLDTRKKHEDYLSECLSA